MKRSKRTTLTILRGAGLAFYLALAIFPLLWIFITSIKPPEEVYTFPIKYCHQRSVGPLMNTCSVLPISGSIFLTVFLFPSALHSFQQ